VGFSSGLGPNGVCFRVVQLVQLEIGLFERISAY
jgi:hypothetical protein